MCRIPPRPSCQPPTSMERPSTWRQSSSRALTAMRKWMCMHWPPSSMSAPRGGLPGEISGNAFQVSSLPLPRLRAALQSAVRQAQPGMRLQKYSITQIPHTIHCKCCTRCCKAKGGRKKQPLLFAAQGLNGGPKPEAVWQNFL